MDDPTHTRALEARIGEVLADPCVQRQLAQLGGEEVALVLSGGGGKGAYELGAILALFDCGIQRFCAIAGTSVGAFNGALCQQLCRTGDRCLVLRLWTNLTPQKVLRFARKTLILKAALYVLMSVFVLSGAEFLKVVQAQATHVDPELDNFKEVSVGSFWISLALAPVVVVALGYLAALVYLLELWSGGGHRIIVGTVIFIAVFVLPTQSYRLGRGYGVFSSAPLRELIEQIDIDSVRHNPPPTLCTLAASASRSASNPFDWLVSPTPVYITLGELPNRAETVNLLLGTAAIPEIFPMQRIRDQGFVDGGAADNRPILGVARYRPAVTIVVYLDHRYGRIEPMWLRDNERRRMRQLCPRKEWLDVGDWWAGCKFMAVIPSKDLGGFFRGTLNFKPEKARDLIMMGYADTLDTVQRYCHEAEASRQA